MTDSLRERQEEYENAYNIKIIKRLPIIIRLKLRNYKRLSQNLDRPYCETFFEIMANTMLYIITEIQDAIFGYYYCDEIILVLRNDKEFDYEPWYQNKVQKIVSIVSSTASIGFYKMTQLFGDDIKIIGDGIFSAKVFALPYITEIINYLIWHQRFCKKNAIQNASLFELEEKFGKRAAVRFLQDKTYEDKIELLLRHCGIDFDNYYPSSFVKGIAAYKIPTIVNTKDGGINKNKWTLNYEIPDFLKDKDFLFNILTNGIDVFRANALK